MKQPEKLTTEKLKKYPGLENITDQEAENIIISFEKFSKITYSLFLKKESKKTNNK